VGAELRVYRRRIRSVASTKKITKAMELIAASRIAKAQARMLAARPYTEELTRALGELSKDSSVRHPMLSGVENPQRAGILIVTSDRGLAGGYNANALKVANQLAARLERDGREVERFVIGRKGAAFYNFRRVPLAGVWTGFSEQPDFERVRPAAEAVVSALLTESGEDQAGPADEPEAPGIDELYVVYTQFTNSVVQTAVSELVAPVKDLVAQQEAEDDTGAEAQGAGASYDFEPEPDQLIAALLPRYVTARIYSALLESAAAESAARRRAMNSASDNATELIRTYTRLANQARQAEITQEISEIVGGADALAAAGSEE
jgi:F-type H+-transporting ATPase subunit gamma